MVKCGTRQPPLLVILLDVDVGRLSVGDVVPVREARYLGILSGYRIGTATGKA